MPFDFAAAVQAPFRMQPGLRRVAAGDPQLTPTSDRHLAEKLLVLDSRAEQALMGSPDFDPAPALQALIRQAGCEHPAVVRSDRPGHLAVATLGWSLQDAQPIALTGARADVGRVLARLAPEWRTPALLALAFEEDFAIVDGQAASIPWMAICLPSFWAPASKVGRGFSEVHGPVADGNLLRAAGEHLLRLASGRDHWERFVWTLTPHPLLRAHPDLDPRRAWPLEAEADALALAAATYWRTERQTFIPLAERLQAVFTIQVDHQPLADAIDTPRKARALHAALASMSDAVIEYRGLGPARPRLLAWLARRSA